MPQLPIANFFVPSSCVAMLLLLAGCSGVVPDEPAKLTPEQEQEILQQVERASAGEQGKVPDGI